MLVGKGEKLKKLNLMLFIVKLLFFFSFGSDFFMSPAIRDHMHEMKDYTTSIPITLHFGGLVSG